MIIHTVNLQNQNFAVARRKYKKIVRYLDASYCSSPEDSTTKRVKSGACGAGGAGERSPFEDEGEAEVVRPLLEDVVDDAARSLLVSAFGNMSVCSLKLRRFADAVVESDAILGKLDPDNVKAIFRKGTALVQLGRWEEARKELRRGLKAEKASEADKKSFAKEIAQINKEIEKMETRRYEESHRGVSEDKTGIAFLTTGNLFG